MERLAWYFWFILCGAALGLGIVRASERLALREGPAGWALVETEVPVLPAMEQPVGEGEGWPLLDNEELRAGRREQVTVEALVPAGGHLEVAIELLRGRSAGVHLSRGEAPASRPLLRESASRGSWLSCDSDLPPPGDAPVAVSVRLVDDTVMVEVDQEVALCRISRSKARGAVIRSGVLRVLLLSVDGRAAPGPAWSLRIGAAAGGAALVALLGWFARRRRWSWAALAALPLLFVAPASGIDAREWVQALRVPASEPLLWVVAVPIVLALIAALAGLVLELCRRRRFVLALLLGALATGQAIALAAPASYLAVIAAAGVGLALAALVAVNVARLRGFNGLSLGLVVAALGLAEAGLRVTETGSAWAGISNREEATLRSDHHTLTVDRAFTSYPASGYPVEPPERSSPVRVVAFGGSSTGGAFTNDALDGFWPAMMARDLGDGVQVVNQGVGGWTSLHIRRYLETGLDAVNPDVALFYVGHNDRVTTSPVPYATLFEAWEGRPGVRVSRWLSRVRLYQGLRFALLSLVRQPTGMAVPLEHARDNIRAMVDLLRERGARVLLIREGVAHGSGLMADYGRMLCAQGREGVGCLDAATVLEDPLAGPVFLDNVHLSPLGHRLLADTVSADLRRRGWLVPRGAPSVGREEARP